MTFVRNSADLSPIKDEVFGVAIAAKQDKEQNRDIVTDATIGSLYDEEGNFVALNSVFDHYDEIDHRTKGAYAASFTGNPAFRDSVYNWISSGTELKLAHSVIATPGGSGAVYMTMVSVLEQGETLIVPDIAWSSYELMAQQNNMKSIRYSMFEGDHFNLASLKNVLHEVLQAQGKALVVVNDPCHNPTGYSLTPEEWNALVDILNEASELGPVVLLNDIAYIDYSYDLANVRKYLNAFNRFNDQVLSVLAFSCSKALTSYGLRCGAAVILAQETSAVRETEIVFEKVARGTWSNIPNAAMANFTWVTTEHEDAFLAEKQGYIDLLKQRSDIFLAEAKEVNLPLYPYKEGFFITVAVPPSLIEAVHQELIHRHIYTVIVNQGIRVAVCSLPVQKAYGLAGKIKETIDAVSVREGR